MCLFTAGNTLKRIHEANILQAQIDQAKADEKEHLAMWRRKVAEVSVAEGELADEDDIGFVSTLDDTNDEIPEDLLQEELAREMEDEDLTPAEKKAKKKADKEKRKAENKEKNKTLKKLGKLIRRQSMSGDRERAASEPTSVELSPTGDAGSMPGSETASLADDTASLHRRRGHSEGSVCLVLCILSLVEADGISCPVASLLRVHACTYVRACGRACYLSTIK